MTQPDPLKRAQERLAEIRIKKDLVVKKTKHLKETFTGFDGIEHPLALRYYQIQGALHLVVMRRFVLGDECGLGKTLQAIAALCYIWEREPDRKVLILTTKSAARQWVGEFKKFTTGIQAFLGAGTPTQRRALQEGFVKNQGPTVLVMGYRAAVQDFTHLQHLKDYILITDECSAFKNVKTQVHQVVAHLSANADRAWGLTATLIKNNLMEGYGIYRALVPGLFQMTPNQFMLYYCIVRMQQLPRSRRQIPVIVGYAAPKVAEFRQVIDPYFIGRPIYEVASELPSLVSRTVEVDMSDLQEEKYTDALEGLLEIGTGADAVVKETTKLSAIAYCQEIVDDLALIDIEAPNSPKLDALIDLLTEGDLEGEKVIIFSRFRKMVDVMMSRFVKEGIKAVRITGAENEVSREAAKGVFQDPSSTVRVICITAAGSEAVNLQAAKAVICYDSPWSAGDFIQLVGRMIRIGSIHDKCFVVHFLARGRKGKTIDHRVMEVLGKKMNLIEAVLGKRFKGDGELATVEVENDISNLFTALQQDARDARSA